MLVEYELVGMLVIGEGVVVELFVVEIIVGVGGVGDELEPDVEDEVEFKTVVFAEEVERDVEDKVEFKIVEETVLEDVI